MILLPACLRSAGAVALLALLAPAYADDWPPVPAEELQMKSEPKAPGAAAIYLYRQIDRDDSESSEVVYSRIKVLTEEGRHYGDVEIPYVKDSGSIRGLQARTLRPDGTVVPFDGEVYDKELVKTRDYRMMAKSFTLPNVEIGSIIEYRYRRTLPSGWVFNSRWLLSEDLFTRRASFSLKPSPLYALRWIWPIGLPPGTEPPKSERGVIRLQTQDVPPFVVEDHMPPEDELKYRVEFVYETDQSAQSDQKQYWAAFGKRVHKELTRFVDDRRALQAAVATIIQPEDPPETRVRKIYARVQQMRNLSFERSQTAQEAQREKLATIRDAEDAWRLGYGDGVQLTWLFLALVRAADVDAQALLVPTRDDFFFDPRRLNSRQLNSNAVVVKLGDREMFLDPGTPFTPFGLLPWTETGVVSLRLDPQGGSWVTTPLPTPTDSRVDRRLTATLTPGGSLQGQLTVTYTGLEAAWRRLNQRNADDAARREFLKSDVEADVPAGIDVDLVNTPDWSGAETPLVAEFSMRVGGWASAAGRRALLPVGLFGAGERHTFEHGARVHPMYFHFPQVHTDVVDIRLPPGWQVSNAPKPRVADIKFAKYSMTSTAGEGSLQLRRELMLNLTLVQQKYYGVVRDFFQSVRAGDEDQAVVQPGAAPATAAAAPGARH